MYTFGMVTTQSSESYTIPALESFFKYTTIQDEDIFFLIDNDGSFDEHKLARFKNVELIKNTAPKSFSANVNEVMRRCHATKSHMVFLNNDLHFTPSWFDSLFVDAKSVVSPLSNREVQYVLSIEVTSSKNVLSQFSLKDYLELENIQGYEPQLNAIVHAHRQVMSGLLPQLTLPFYCVLIPYDVFDSVGYFDEQFGIAGGEDFDYCLRCWEKGLPVAYSLQSLIIHYGGKATWDSKEKSYHRGNIEKQFVDSFISKWGAELQRLAFNFDSLAQDSLLSIQKQGRYQELVVALKPK